MTGIFLIFSACILWALDTLVRYPLLFSGVSPWSIVWFEHLFLVLVMLYWMRPLWRKALFDRRALLAFLVVGGLGSAVSTVAFTNAFTLINPSVVILIQKLQPLVAVTLAAVLLKERVDRHFVFWLGVCLLGSLLIAAGDLMPALQPANWAGRESRDLLLGYGCTLIAVLGWGAATVFGKQLSNRGFSTTDLMSGRFLVGFLVLTPLAWLLASPTEVLDMQMPLQFLGEGPTFNVLTLIAAMVLISGLGGMGFYYLGMQRLPARTCAVAEMFFPVAAVIINWLVLGQTLTALQIVGAAVLLGGSTMVALSQSAQTPAATRGSSANESVTAPD
ncbi:DMT family transporter [Granulosicoccus sp. 3-233]|uniref:DMT family transporter n=1 Tax=Granulosicoccus sp. 3-233 TaxID=3417969 RepID=UPI003D33BD76